MSYIKVEEPLNRIEIEDILIDFVQGITNLPENAVRPAHQLIHPTFNQGDNICVFNITDERHKGMWRPVKETISQRTELYVRFHFYGNESYRFAKEFLYGILIEQNARELWLKGIAYMSHENVIEIPENINEIEVMRHDVLVRFSVARNFKIEGTNYFSDIPNVKIYGGRNNGIRY